MLKISENRNCYYEETQRNILLTLINQQIIEKSFFLTGGTALSVFYLHHRKSNDLDFFTIEQVELSELDFLLKTLWGRDSIKIQESKNFLSILIMGIKADFVIDQLSNNEKRERYSFENNKSLMIDNLNNIISNKLCALASRTEPKDFVDFYLLRRSLREKSFEDIYSDACLKEAIFDDPPTAAYQIEENLNFIKANQEIFPEVLFEFDMPDFYKFYEDIIKRIYRRMKI